jgi:hypothetical protein
MAVHAVQPATLCVGSYSERMNRHRTSAGGDGDGSWERMHGGEVNGY